MKRVLKLGFVMLITMAFVFMGCKHEDENSEGTSGPEIVELGMWPQTIKATDVIVDESNSKIVGMFTYYKGNDGAWYVKQKETPYESGYKYSDGTDVAQSSENSYKYFKVEPIKWIVLSDNYSGKKLLHSEKDLIAHRYAASSNNYKNSEIRSWLNNSFFNTAFSSTEQDRIADTNVDNSARSTNPDTNPSELNNGTNSQACADTTDKIFLLSVQEVTKSEYGFADYESAIDSNGTIESTRIRMSTDFAKASGTCQWTTVGYGIRWWLRSPDYSNSDAARFVRPDGHVYNTTFVHNMYHPAGVCPALCLK